MTPAQTAIVARRTIEGAPVRTIADEVGLHHSQVVRTRQKPEIRSLIESEIESLITKGMRPARRTLCRLAAMGNTKEIDKDTIKLSLDASKAIMGMVQGQPGTIITNLIQINHAPEHRQELDGLQDFLKTQWGGSKVSR
jgi:hypothetical protein